MIFGIAGQQSGGLGGIFLVDDGVRRQRELQALVLPVEDFRSLPPGGPPFPSDEGQSQEQGREYHTIDPSAVSRRRRIIERRGAGCEIGWWHRHGLDAAAG